MFTFWLNLVAALATFAGSMMMAFSVGKLPGEAYQIDKRGKKIQIAGIRRGRFYQEQSCLQWASRSRWRGC